MQESLPRRPCPIDYGKYLSNEYEPEKCLLILRFELHRGQPKFKFCELYKNQLRGMNIFEYVYPVNSTDAVYDLKYEVDATNIESLFTNQYREFKNLYNDAEAYILDYSVDDKYYLYLK